MNNIIQRCITSVILLLMLAIAWITPLFMTVLLLISCIHILTVEWPKLAKNSLFLWLITPFYIIIPFLIFLKLNLSADRNLLFVSILIIAAFDSGSYIGGKRWGNHSLCPSISPNKTIEGVIGGLFTANIVGYSMYYWIAQTFLPIFYNILLLLLCLFALFGDLFESWLKRKSGLKDSGCLLPGHGGLLDRFDSYLWSSYFLIVIIIYLKK